MSEIESQKTPEDLAFKSEFSEFKKCACDGGSAEAANVSNLAKIGNT